MSGNRRVISIGNKKVGDDYPVYIVFEAGPTHDGFDTARKLVDVACKAGADAVKFQIVNARKLVPDRGTLFTYRYLEDRETGRVRETTESLQEILLRRELSPVEWKKLIDYCRSKNLEFFATVTDEEELDFLSRNGVDTIKICSGDINHFPLMNKATHYDWSIQIDTGCATLGEIEAAVDFLEGTGFDRIIINHCPSGYPADPDRVNLRVLETLRQMFPYPVAFSDHSPHWQMDVAAVALGANMIEKTITLDKTTKSPEHIMSLEPGEARNFVEDIRNLEKALGARRRTISGDEKIRCNVARRSICAARDLHRGEILREEMLTYCRPGTGIAPHMSHMLLGRRLARNVKCGAQLSYGDFEWDDAGDGGS